MKKGTTRPLNLIKKCTECGDKFSCADPKRGKCPKCSVCQYCGVSTRAKSRTCQKCRGSHQTELQKAQLKRLHKSICGANNPSKRADVRKKLSDTKLGDLNPARNPKYRDQYIAHIAKYRPGKVSKLEDMVARRLPLFERQYKIGWYSVDFADPAEKVVVEVQGCWYHSCPICFPGSPMYKTQRLVRGNDLRRTKFLTDRGWTILRIWEHDIRYNPWFNQP